MILKLMELTCVRVSHTVFAAESVCVLADLSLRIITVLLSVFHNTVLHSLF